MPDIDPVTIKAVNREIPDADHLHEECGVFGVYGHPDSAALVALGLHALQQRVQRAIARPAEPSVPDPAAL